jgi:hypothetical protein
MVMSHTVTLSQARTPLERARAVLVPTGTTERALLGVAAVFAAVGALHVIPFIADGSTWEGAVSWRKPIVFGLSIGIATWWVAWVLGNLSWRPRTKAAWAIGYTTMMVVEYTLITAQRWRGVASHFNNTTPFDAMVFAVMGISIGVVTVLIAVLLAPAVRRPPADSATRWAVVGGLALMLVGSALGGVLVQMGGAQSIDGAAPDVVRAGAAGAPKYAHAVALHVPQLLVGLLALVEAAGLSSAARRNALRRGVITSTALIAATSAHTLAGHALLDVTNPTGVFLLAAAASCAWPFASAMMAAWRHDNGPSRQGMTHEQLLET